MVILRRLAASNAAVQQRKGKIFYTFRRILYNGRVMRIAALDTAATLLRQHMNSKSKSVISSMETTYYLLVAHPFNIPV